MLKVPQRIVRRVCLLLGFLLFAVTVNVGLAPEQAEAQRQATVNVPAAIFFVDCPGEWSVSESVGIAYMQLNGQVEVREATVQNGRLVYINDIPAVVFEQLSMNWWDFEVIYRFITPDGRYTDLMVYPGKWNRDAQSGVIYQGFGC